MSCRISKGGDGKRRLAIIIITCIDLLLPVHMRRTYSCLDLLLLRTMKSHPAGLERSLVDRYIHHSNHDDGSWIMGAVFPWSVRSLDVCRRNIEMAGSFLTSM